MRSTRVAGAPPPGTAVVLLHGVIVSSRYLTPLGVELARDRPSALIPYLAGSGLSEPPPCRVRGWAVARMR